MWILVECEGGHMTPYAARVAEVVETGERALLIALLVEMAGKLDLIDADAMARRVVWADKKRRQRMSPNVPETMGDNGGHRGTNGDIGGHFAPPSPLHPLTPTTTTTTTTKATTKTTTSDEPPSRFASRRGRAEQRSSAVRQTWLTPSAEVWEQRVGAFHFGKAAGLLASLHKAGLSADEIATRLSAYLDTMDNPVYASLARFAETHALYAHGKPRTAADLEYERIAAEAADVGRMSA